jgi:hypothetical protein
MNLGDMFRQFVPQAASAPATTTTQQPTSLQTPNTAQNMNDAATIQQGNPPAPGTQQQAGVQQQTENPLAEFAKMWEPKKDVPEDSFQQINANPAKIKEIADTINFTSSLNPELVKKALSGDANAFLQVINTANQQAFAMAMQASSALADKQASSAVDFMKKTLPGQFKQLSVQNDLHAENPQFSNPAVQPLLNLVQERLAVQFPDATPLQLKEHAKKYISGMVQVFAPGSTVPGQEGTAVAGEDENATFLRNMQKQQQQANNFDWDAWASAQSQPSRSS